MTWFADLSPYTYRPSSDGRVRVNVGWLERGQPFDVGPSSPELMDRLAKLVAHASVAQTRGWHACDLCARRPPDDDDARMSSAEIRVVAADGTIYAAPSLILHYVAAHGYRPPPEFVTAALAHAGLDFSDVLARDQCFSCGSSMERLNERDGYRYVDDVPVPLKAIDLHCERCAEDYSRTVFV